MIRDVVDHSDPLPDPPEGNVVVATGVDYTNHVVRLLVMIRQEDGTTEAYAADHVDFTLAQARDLAQGILAAADHLEAALGHELRERVNDRHRTRPWTARGTETEQ